MLRAGRYYTLTVSRISEYGLYLKEEVQTSSSEESDKNNELSDSEIKSPEEVLLPNRYTSLTDKVGDKIDVFVYHDSEDRLVATTEKPLLANGEAGFLEVVDKTVHGAFLKWGLHGKDLFLPNRNQQGGVTSARPVLVYLYEDNITGRCVATQKFKQYIHNDGDITVKPKEEVSLLIASHSEIGWRVIINNRHWGMLYRNQLFRTVKLGERLTGYVRRITEDNRIDVSLQQQGYREVQNSSEKLKELISKNGGFLPLNDASTPEEIARLTEMSKKVFKRSVGMLLKSGEVEFIENGIKLTK